MKRLIVIIALVSILCACLTGCAKTYHETDELMAKAREELPISDADTVEMQYAGMSENGSKAIAWFISGDEYQTHYYLPMEIELKNNGTDYAFVHTYKPMSDNCPDVAIVNWGEGYAFLVNNPDVAAVRMTLENGEVSEETVGADKIPYAFYVSSALSEYVFLDADGNEIQ